ncbi:LacI family DNA-binding transcriptional regulator [Tumebacillus permanentifrigoris]|uniref:LacI family transcriptional regulator n=1 Tax=Tumebacillus permanentifrigoris TaxID=378543 RepID=A0A316E0I2_9BACL|nr:LacI family DNA-binding transcriptional regulator [Tumebacillus permanentifrigoris]PWK16320.1 LacI family transcriptional regulator [Tumebacillus permanentifrigoris]
MNPTIKDVAKAAGVSITTVSRVLNQYSDVNPKTRAKVLKVVEQLGYKPNSVARSLVMNRTNTVGLVVSDLSRSRNGHHFMFEVLCGINDRVQELGYDLVLFSTSTTAQKKTPYMDFVRQRRVDGVLMMGIRLDDPYTHEVVAASVPSVLIDVPLTSQTCSYVSTDNIAGARMAIEHLLELGHSRIGFVNGHAQAAVSQERLQGYRMALEAGGIAYDPQLVYYGNFEQEDGAIGTAELRSRFDDLTAVFFASDLMALGALKYVQNLGLRVPENLSIVGFDDIELAALMQPMITTVRQKRYEMGRSAAESLIRILEQQEQGRGIILPPELVVRETTAPHS